MTTAAATATTEPAKQTRSWRNSSPPSMRQLSKTPVTPIPTSKSSSFHKSRFEEPPELFSANRSISSIHQIRRVTPTPSTNGRLTNSSPMARESDPMPNRSPFISSSLPKEGLADRFFKRPKTGGDCPTSEGPLFDERKMQKAASSGEAMADKSTPKSPPPEPVTEKPQTPSSMSSLRRKLSLSWRRGGSKGSITAPSDLFEKGVGQHKKQESMPPPRLPASATTNSLPSVKRLDPSPTVGPIGGYLESRRRKSSAASLTNLISHDRSRTDAWAGRREGDDPVTVPVSRGSAVASKILKLKTPSNTLRSVGSWVADLDKDDLAAEEEMRKLGSRRKETEVAARTLDALRKRATPKERVSPQEALRIAVLNIYERGEIIDFEDIYFCGTRNAHKVMGDVRSDAPNYGYDDERGDYTIVPGDHIAYRYEIVDVLGKGSFGQVVRCIDHKLGVLVAVKIIRNKKRFHQQALVEVNILQKLREWVGLRFGSFPPLQFSLSSPPPPPPLPSFLRWRGVVGFEMADAMPQHTGPSKQAQHGEFHAKLLLSWSLVHIDGASGHEPVRVHQGAQFPRLLATHHQTIHEADTELADSFEAAPRDPLRPEAGEHSAPTSSPLGDQGD